MSFLDTLNRLFCRPGRQETLSRLIEYIDRRFDRMEALMSNFSTELNDGLTELGSAITELATRIDEIPTDANDVTQEQVDNLRATIARVKSLAVKAPEVPTPDLPAEPGDDGTTPDVPAEPSDPDTRTGF